MKKCHGFAIAVFAGLVLSALPFNDAKAQELTDTDVILYDSRNLDDIFNDLYLDYGDEELEIVDEELENDSYSADNSDSEETTNLEIEVKKSSDVKKNSSRDKKIEDRISKMTLDEKIGQMLMLEFRHWEDEEGNLKEVTELNEDIIDAIVKYRVGGVILFAENVRDTEQTTKLTHNIQKAAIKNGLEPLLISIDQEGGIVVRLGTGTSLPGNMALGATRDKKLAYKYGKIIAEEIKALGINVNLAPVLDTNNNPKNPVIGLRSISSDPNLVGDLGSEVIKGLQDQGVSAAIKHFPGHGDTDVDSHLGLPVVDKSMEEVERLELVPFNKAADEGVDMIMTAHISYPQLEKDTVISKKDGSIIGIPATLSDDIITGIIRKKMFYNGIVITDAMKMQAIADHFGEEEAVVMAVKAGVDIPLMPTLLQKKSDLLKLDSIISRLKDEINIGNIRESQINDSVYRILDLKSRRGILQLDQYNYPLESKIENAMNVVGNKEHFDAQREITQNAITVTKNNNNVLPFYPKAFEKVLIYTPYDNEVPGFAYGFDKLQSEGVIDKDVLVDVKSYQHYKDGKNDSSDELRKLSNEYDYVIAVSEIGRAEQLGKDNWLAQIPDLLTTFAKENGKKTAIISVGKPYDLDRFKNSDAHILAYGSKGMDPTEKGKDPLKTFGPNIPYSLDIVFGKVKSVGKLPVDVPGLNENYEYTNEIAYNIGYGIETNLKSENIDKETDSKSNNNQVVEKEDTIKTLTSEVIENKSNKSSYNSKSDKNPSTGIGSLTYIGAVLIGSFMGLVTINKNRK